MRSMGGVEENHILTGYIDDRMGSEILYMTQDDVASGNGYEFLIHLAREIKMQDISHDADLHLCTPRFYLHR